MEKSQGIDVHSVDKVDTHITQREEKYWSEFYARHAFEKGSSFFELLGSQPFLPGTVVDIGCGQGRDSFAFARSGKTVIGLDRSDVGVTTASEKAAAEQLDSTLCFSVCDVSDEQSLLEALSVAREAGDGNLCYYMRFFLHSIPEDTQAKLLQTISQHAITGDVFAAEFRTDKDEDQEKAFGSTHYRRYQNAEEFSQNLREVYGWQALYEVEGQGLSPYGDEDPVLYRVIASRT